MKKIGLILIAAFLSFSTLYGQEKTPSQIIYYNQELFVNPAFAGSQDVFSSTIGLQQQWAGFNKSPNMQRLQAHSSFFNNKVGLGLNLQNESYGVTRNFNLSTHYAYRIKMSKGTLALGLQLGFATAQEALADIYTPTPDRTFSENSNLMWGFSTGVGAYYTTDKYYIGLSIPHLIDNRIKASGGALVNKLDFDKMPFYLAGGYVFALNSSFNLKPSALLSYSKYFELGYNFNLTAFYKDKYWIGALARKNNELGGAFGLNILDYVNLNYAFTITYGNLYESTNRGAIHEVTLNVLLDLVSGKPKFKYF